MSPQKQLNTKVRRLWAHKNYNCFCEKPNLISTLQVRGCWETDDSKHQLFLRNSETSILWNKSTKGGKNSYDYQHYWVMRVLFMKTKNPKLYLIHENETGQNHFEQTIIKRELSSSIDNQREWICLAWERLNKLSTPFKCRP